MIVKRNILAFWSTLYCGACIGSILNAIHQDFYGGLDGYIEHLRTHWVDPCISGPISCALLGIMVLAAWYLRRDAIARDEQENV